jgi:hypothetical protein
VGWAARLLLLAHGGFCMITAAGPERVLGREAAAGLRSRATERERANGPEHAAQERWAFGPFWLTGQSEKQSL